MRKIKLKAIQLKSWVTENIRGEDGEISFVKTFFFSASWFGTSPFIVLLLKVIIRVLNGLYIAIPYVTHFIEGLISALSYSLNKKEFFYGF